MHRLLLIVLAFLLIPHEAAALSSQWQRDDIVAVRLVSGVEGTGQKTSIPLGLEVNLAPEWRIYWRSPGEAGIPPTIDWNGTAGDDGNLKNAEILYPIPKRFRDFGLETIGYVNSAVFPIDAEVLTPGKPLNINAVLNMAVCNTTCIPKSFDLQLTIPGGESLTSKESAIIEMSRAYLPEGEKESKLRLIQTKYGENHIQFVIVSSEPLRSPDLFVESLSDVFFSTPVVSLSKNGMMATFQTSLKSKLPTDMSISALPLTITVSDGGGNTLEKYIPPASISPAGLIQNNILFIVLLSMLGGFLLNLMPCVLPVLSLKIISVVKSGGKKPDEVRHSFIATSMGIVFSFIILAIVTASLKEAGYMVGWGLQFQQPLFLIFLIFLISIFALNLLGLFEIKLPLFLTKYIHKKEKMEAAGNFAGDFLSGILATLLSTPCSAPFLGTTVGFALATNTPTIMLVFTALGIGVALPYILVAWHPRLVTLLPKPGPWMVRLRSLMGLALALTAAWLVVIMLSEEGPMYQSKILKTQQERSINWHNFDETEIARYIKEGKTVFVYIEADWCITCKANKKLILEQEEIPGRLFNDPNVIALKADWTKPNPMISTFLQRYGKYGIPFSAVFGPNMPSGVVLPELLTKQSILDTLEQARQ